MNKIHAMPTLIPRVDRLTNASEDNLFVVAPGELQAGSFNGGAGTDTLQLAEGGTFDLTLPQVFTSIEIVRGSDQHGTIILNQETFAGMTAFDGGASPAIRLDEIVLEGSLFDFRAKTLTGIDKVSLVSDNAVLIAPDLQTALLATGIASQGDRLEATGITFTPAQIKILHRQGIDIILDAAGPHVNAAPVMKELNGGPHHGSRRQNGVRRCESRCRRLGWR